MATKGRSAYVPCRKRLKWKIRNNYAFFIIVAIICAIVASVFAFKVYNLERQKNMEALLDKSRRRLHWETGMTAQDAEKLRKVYPNFDWEDTWDRERGGGRKAPRRDILRGGKAIQSYRLQKEKERHQLKTRERTVREK